MARFIRGTVRLELQPVDLGAVLESAVDAVKPAADARRVMLSVDAPRGIAIVSGDASRLQQVAWNLLSNSIKFSERRRSTSMRASRSRDDDAVLRVTDTVSGIDPAFLPHVFDRFRQEISDVTREHAGLGLGLSLVRHLTELHGGRVTAQSDGKDCGATFTVRLPLDRREGRPRRRVRTVDDPRCRRRRRTRSGASRGRRGRRARRAGTDRGDPASGRRRGRASHRPRARRSICSSRTRPISSSPTSRCRMPPASIWSRASARIRAGRRCR